jgi:hypothetical protein
METIIVEPLIYLDSTKALRHPENGVGYGLLST